MVSDLGGVSASPQGGVMKLSVVKSVRKSPRLRNWRFDHIEEIPVATNGERCARPFAD